MAVSDFDQVEPQPDFADSQYGWPPGRFVVVGDPINRMSADGTGRRGVFAYVLMDDVLGRPTEFRVELREPILDQDGNPVDLTPISETGRAWVERNGWTPALDALSRVWLESANNGEHAARRRAVDQLRAQLEQEALDEEARNTFLRALEETFEERVELVVDSGQEAAKKAAKAIGSAILKASLVAGVTLIGLRALVAAATKKPEGARR